MLSFTVACSGGNEVSKGLVLNDVLKKEQETYNETWRKHRSEIEFQSGVSVRNCADYVREVKRSHLSESVNNQLVKSEYLRCEVLDLVGETFIGDEEVDRDYGELIAERLDLRSFPSSMFQIASDEKFTLRAVFPDDTQTKRNGVIYESDDWVFGLDLVAVVDVDDNGLLDWIMWLADESKEGNYHSYTTLVSFDVSDAAVVMTAVPYALVVSGNSVSH